jgi:hypothetical protein
MADFRSFRTARREQAAPKKPLADPAGWAADDLRDVSRWSYCITASDADELEAAVAAVRRRGVAMVDIRKDDFPLGAFAEVLTDVRHELMDGRGIVMMQGFPLDRFDREGAAIAYIGLGCWLGRTMSQNKMGTFWPREDRRLHDPTPRLHDQCRNAVPHRRLRLCRALVPADADVGRREPHR